jgi:hypothetical protein
MTGADGQTRVYPSQKMLPQGKRLRILYPFAMFVPDAGNPKSTMWKLTLCYDGSPFAGWQVQPRLCTVQGELSSALRRVTGETVLPQGSGRTDAGVHALGQVASFALAAPVPPAQQYPAPLDPYPGGGARPGRLPCPAQRGRQDLRIPDMAAHTLSALDRALCLSVRFPTRRGGHEGRRQAYSRIPRLQQLRGAGPGYGPTKAGTRGAHRQRAGERRCQDNFLLGLGAAFARNAGLPSLRLGLSAPYGPQPGGNISLRRSRTDYGRGASFDPRRPATLGRRAYGTGWRIMAAFCRILVPRCLPGSATLSLLSVCHAS